MIGDRVRLDQLVPGASFRFTDDHGSVRGQVIEAGANTVRVQLEQGPRRLVVRELAGGLLVEPIEEQTS